MYSIIKDKSNSMRKMVLLLLVIGLLSSCGNSGSDSSVDEVIANGDVNAIKAKRKELLASYQELQDKMKKLDNAIESKSDTSRKSLITTVPVKDTLFKHYIELQGNVKTRKNLVLFPEASGVLRLHVEEGQKVGKGQLLASVDDGGMRQQVSQLEIQATLAKTTYERQKRLWDQKIGSEIQYLQAKSTYEAQEQAVQQAKSQLARTTIRAPFGGVVDEIITEQGAVAIPGQTQVIRLVSLNDMYVEADVPEQYVSTLTKGTEVEVGLPVIGQTLDSKVRQVSNFINPANRSFQIEVGVPNKEGLVKPNLTARLKVNDYTKEKAILVPQNVLSENAEGEQYVYVVTDEGGKKIAKQVIVETGKAQNGMVEIIKGLTVGMQLIDEGARRVKDGQEVAVIDQEIEEA